MGHKLISTISEIETKCKTINSFKIITQIIKIFFSKQKKCSEEDSLVIYFWKAHVWRKDSWIYVTAVPPVAVSHLMWLLDHLHKWENDSDTSRCYLSFDLSGGPDVLVTPTLLPSCTLRTPLRLSRLRFDFFGQEYSVHHVYLNFLLPPF